MYKPLYIFFGYVAAILGLIGAFLPVLPTTPFLILAAYCFSKSSPRLHSWIISVRYFGPLVKEWEDYGVIRFKAKVWCTIIIVGVLSATIIYANIPLWVQIVQMIIMVLVVTFVWSRPSFKGEKNAQNSNSHLSS